MRPNGEEHEFHNISNIGRLTKFYKRYQIFYNELPEKTPEIKLFWKEKNEDGTHEVSRNITEVLITESIT